MAYNQKPVLLGFEDEYITEKNKGFVNFSTNKIGGKPDFPAYITIDNPICTLCQLPRPLVLQIYAPLDNSQYHRTLYLFACINPNCWNQADSWACIRIQSLEQETEKINLPTINHPNIDVNEWCQGADDWDDDNNVVEENGNLIGGIERVSDEDEESCSTEESIRTGIGNLTVDDRNANLGSFAEAQGGAVGRLHSPRATAEIEGDEGEIITIDTPTFPQVDLTALLQEVTPLPQSLCHNTCSNLETFSNLQFVSCFISVWEESEYVSCNVERHAKELLLEYQQNNDSLSLDDVASGDGGGGGAEENYEKSAPAHGDKMFHYFLTKIQNNPGQILRYGREEPPPLLMKPLHEKIRKCEYCDGEMIFEFQVLPTLISKLKLVGDHSDGSRLEFGTVLIFTCRKSCWTSDNKVRKEFVILQSEQY
ncbi:hypothetical protein FQR65_LT04106 [Abscondita terminalis]|nr:hypothetical protein FQR65_LT04106 [Abscondita terminalis]